MLNASFDSSRQSIHPLLPTVPGSDGERILSAEQKQEVNKFLGRNGFILNHDRAAKISVWSKEDTVYWVFHEAGKRGRIFLIESVSANESDQQESETLPVEVDDGEALPINTELPLIDDETVSIPKQRQGEKSASHNRYSIGMYVRVPIQEQEKFEQYRATGDLRDFRIGRITEINPLAESCSVTLQVHTTSQDYNYTEDEHSLDDIQRCHILSDTEFRQVGTSKYGTVLIPTKKEFIDGELCEYYVQIDGEVKVLTEDQLLVAAHRQDVDPSIQIANYEFHHPSFRSERDPLIESYAELHATTFGLEDLVGSRVRLLAHQADVIATVLADETCRYILADEVGLGKTIEACVILKGLQRQNANMRTLIIAPSSLIQQWYFELDKKFWLEFAVDQIVVNWEDAGYAGAIISTERIEHDRKLSKWLEQSKWDLLVVDEAHHVHKQPALYQKIRRLSKSTKQVLILSATPIQKNKLEFLALLRLVNPQQYDNFTVAQFEQILDAQEPLRNVVLSLTPYLNIDNFDLEEFVEEMEEATESFEDSQLTQLIADVSTAPSIRQQLEAAKNVISYISENYRIENRIIRNRRSSLQIELPTRTVDDTYSYRPSQWEAELLDDLYDYIDAVVKSASSRSKPFALEYGRVLLHAAFSSPDAIDALLAKREKWLQSKGTVVTKSDDLLVPAAPRSEHLRIEKLIYAVPAIGEERQKIGRLRWLCNQWQTELLETLSALHWLRPSTSSPYRASQILRAIHDILRKQKAAKIVVFSSWAETLIAIKPFVEKLVSYDRGKVAEFHSQLPPSQLQTEADNFQSSDEYNVLLCDELGGEGRNFQMADMIIHIDLPWTPAQIEQRIGRVDRLGRTGNVRSVVPFAQEQVEHDLFRIWHEAFSLFTQSMSGMEIVLETILDKLVATLGIGVRDSLRDLLPMMIEQAEGLRETVDEERYFEEGAIDQRQRDHFARVSETYRDGTLLGVAFKRWANQVGLINSYKQDEDILVYYPKQFNLKMMQNAHFLTVPNMEDALRRSGRERNLKISGTFNRDIAVQREDLVFYTPRNDQWTEALLKNAFEADRGRCCAIRRKSAEITEPWQGFELFYTFQVDPRPLYEKGSQPIHLHKAQEYLALSNGRLLISTDGDLLKNSNPIRKIVEHRFSHRTDKHLGKRGDKSLSQFKDMFPADIWEDILQRIFVVAHTTLSEDYYFPGVADEATEKFAQRIAGKRASIRWLNQTRGTDPSIELANLQLDVDIANALVQGIRNPLWRLESVCFWMIEPE